MDDICVTAAVSPWLRRQWSFIFAQICFYTIVNFFLFSLFHLFFLLILTGVNILPNKWIRHPGTITDFLGLWVELLLARSADSNSAQRPKIRYLYNDVTISNSTQKFLTKFFLCDELIEFGKKNSSWCKYSPIYGKN